MIKGYYVLCLCRSVATSNFFVDVSNFFDYFMTNSEQAGKVLRITEIAHIMLTSWLLSKYIGIPQAVDFE